MLAIASRPGTCALCRQPIVSGELISHDDDRDAWVHARCDEAAPPSRHRQHPRAVPRARQDRFEGVERGRPARGEARRTAPEEDRR
jgi:hypothetical protein